MKHFKLSIFTFFLIILFLPTVLFTALAIPSISMLNSPHPNEEFVNSEYFATGDNIGFITDWCKTNYKITEDDEEALSRCIDSELKVEGAAWGFGLITIIGSIIFLPIFILSLFFYVRWIRRNYFPNGAPTRS